MKNIKTYKLFEMVDIVPEIYGYIANNDIESLEDFVDDEDNFSRLDTSYKGMTPLNRAIFDLKNKIAKILIEAGADPDAKTEWNITPLLYASYDNNMEVIRYLIEANADWSYVDENKKTFLENLNHENAEIIISEFSEEYTRYNKRKKTKEFNL